MCFLLFLCLSIILCTFRCFVLSKIPVVFHYFVYFLVLCVVYDTCVSPLFCVLSDALCCLSFLYFSIILCNFWCFVLSTIPVFLHYCVYFLVICVVYDTCVSPLLCVLSCALYCLRFRCLSIVLCTFSCFVLSKIPVFSIILCTFWCFMLSKISVFLHYFVYFLVLCVV